MKLVIAEKPSVAQSIAAVLGASKRCDGYLEGNDYLVSWCFGHLAELTAPENYDPKFAKWRYDDLPIVPENWQYAVASDKEKQMHMTGFRLTVRIMSWSIPHRSRPDNRRKKRSTSSMSNSTSIIPQILPAIRSP